ncbi:MAG TPA: LAGLIDADG family homing endonuclease [Candidatus Paceibacterota bacterium]|nr:LAGLIDADG family homing endonuclease [Candidatus Paceibacterota bacterium]
MSKFASDIMKQKYSHLNKEGEVENWQNIAYRVSKKVLQAVRAPHSQIEATRKIIENRKFIPGGRYLASTGRLFHQVNNCGAGETRVVTKEGVKTLKELSGTKPTLMTTNGTWVEADVKSFGKQPLLRVRIRRDKYEKDLYMTPEHSWRIAKYYSNGRCAHKVEVLTKDLKPGDMLWQVFGYGAKRTPISIDGIRHGIVFGSSGSEVVLCGKKNLEILKFFKGYKLKKHESGVKVSGLPKTYKDLPSLQNDRSYLLGWLCGYFAADGCVSKDGKIELASTNLKNLERVREICYVIGIGTKNIRKQVRISNLTKKTSVIYYLPFIPSTLSKKFFLISKHRENFKIKKTPIWSVVSVNKTNRFEEVFCAIVPETHEFVLEDNILTGNCFLFRAEDSREGWADLMHKITLALMTGGGIGVDYSDVREEGRIIRKTGGKSTGPLALMQMVNEAGRFIMQGGSRRSAIWAGLNWKHPDIQKFIRMKDWSEVVKLEKTKNFNFPAVLDMTNISVLLDDEFFEAYHNEKHEQHVLATSVYWSAIRHMLETGEPGFSIDVGKNSRETLRNAPICGDVWVLTSEGYKEVKAIINKPVTIWTGKRWALNVVFQKTKSDAPIVKVKMTGGRYIRCDESHEFLTGSEGFFRVPAKDLKPGDVLYTALNYPEQKTKFHLDSYILGYMYGDGTFNKNGTAEITFCTEKSIKCAKPMSRSSIFSSMNRNSKGYLRAYFKKSDFWSGRNKSTFPKDVYAYDQHKALSFVAGLFDSDGNYESKQNRIRLASKHESFLRGVARLLEQFGIFAGVTKAGISTFGKSQGYQLVVMSEYNDMFSKLIPTIRVRPRKQKQSNRHSVIKVVSVESDGVEDVYCADVRVDEHSFQAEGVIISNCTEITSSDDSDVCNLGSINMARIESLEEMERVVELGSAFLLAGTVYSDVPFAAIDKVRSKNRRLGLGLMGLHEWLLKKGKKYGPDEELAKYLEIYAKSGKMVAPYVKKWELSQPVKTRAIAPNGTIGIIAETTTGIEPIFCAAYKRRYLKGDVWHFQYVVDPTAKRLLDSGVPLELIEDAYDLAKDVERRVAFQAWVQEYVDHSISSTINLPKWGSELNNENKVRNFGDMLIKYLPKLRGITVYPDGSRPGQPLNPVPLAVALSQEGHVFEESGSTVCDITKGGECG